MKKDSFWSQQPVGDNLKSQDLTGVKNTPYVLPNGFEFTNVSDTQELSKFLNENYVEDDDEEFRLLYSDTFLAWMLSNPKHKDEYSLGIQYNNKLVGYIFGKETDLIVNTVKKKVAAVNFLCILKDMRHKRMAPLLIMELTRRFNCNGIFQGVFTAGTDLFSEIVSCKYFHHPLNGEKLYKAGFTNQVLNTEVKESRMNTRRIKESDLEDVYKIYKGDIKNYKMIEDMDFEDFKWYLCNKQISTFVYEHEGEIKSFGMYYILETLSIQQQCTIKGAYLGIVCGHNTNMVRDLVFHAYKSSKADVFNCLDIGQNKEVIEDMCFIEGTGRLKYYLYNWGCSTLDKSDVFFYLV